MNKWEYEMSWSEGEEFQIGECLWYENGETGEPRENPKNPDIAHHNGPLGDFTEFSYWIILCSKFLAVLTNSSIEDTFSQLAKCVQ